MTERPLLKSALIEAQTSETSANACLKLPFYEILANLILVRDGLRPGYLFQVDTYSKTYQTAVLECLTSMLEALQPANFHQTKLDVGVLYTRCDMDLDAALAQYYVLEGAEKDDFLGYLLGYPCVGDQRDYTESRCICNIVTASGTVLLSNVASSPESVARFRALYVAFREHVERVLGIQLTLEII